MDHVFVMRSLRNFLYLLVGLFIGANLTLAHAEGSVGAPSQQQLDPTWTGQITLCGGTGVKTSSFTGKIAPACAVIVPAVWNGTQDIGCGSDIITITGTYPGDGDACGFTWQNEKGNAGPPTQLLVAPTCAPGYSRKGTPGAGRYCESDTPTCPANSDLQGGTCTCKSGYTAQNGQCVASKCTSQFEVNGSTYAPSASDLPYEICNNGCKATVKEKMVSKTDCKVLNGIKSCKVTYRYQENGGGSSDQCTADSSNSQPPNNNSIPESCGSNQGMIKVDGVTRCVNKSNGQEVPTTPPTTETKNNEKTTVTNPNGTTTVTNVTNNTTTGGTTTVTNIYGPGVDPNSPTAVPISSTTSTTGGGANGEGKGTGTGTSSGDGEGDKDACEDDPQRVGCKHLDEILGDVPAPESINTSETSVGFTPASGFGSGSYSCPANQHITLKATGQSITAFDWQPACTFADGVKPVVLAFAFLGAALIGLGANKQ